MKVSLVVSSGAHQGRVIPLTSAQFVIGRDASCNLRPASPAISKVHCAVTIRDGKVFVKDYGSTNGTLVNEELIQATEVEVETGASLRVGPLDFTVKIEQSVAKSDGTPLPGNSPEAAAALAAVKATAAKSQPPSRDTTPAPNKPTKPATTPTPAQAGEDDDHDRIAAMLLGMDDDGNGNVPDGSTVMEMPSPLAAAGADGEKKPDDKKPEKKAQTREEMSDAANDLLRQYMRKPGKK